MFSHFKRLSALCLILSGATLTVPANSSEITVPEEWVKTFLKLGDQTVKKEIEFAACLTYGEVKRDIEGETATLKKISELSEKRMAAINANDAALAQTLADESAQILKTLENTLSVDPPKEYGTTETTVGITLTVDKPPVCIGSYIGNMHTHPDDKHNGKIISKSYPSDGDTAFTLDRFALYGSRQNFVVSHNHATLMIPTQDFINRFDPTEPNPAGKENINIAMNELKQMTFLLETSDQIDLLPALLKSYGLVYYEGDLPVLHKVEIPEQSTNGPLQYVNGTFKPRRAAFDNALAQAKMMVKNKEHIETPADLDKGADAVRAMNDTQYMHALGLPYEEMDIRRQAQNTTEYYDVGACVLSETDTAFTYAAKCSNNARFDLSTIFCNKQPSPMIGWETKDPENSAVTFVYPDPENKNKCMLKVYKLGTDGKAGELIKEGSVNKF